MEKKTALVSIIIPCYNSAKFVKEAIESALNQTYPSVEIIVVDDGSTDESMAVLREYANIKNVIVLQHEGGVNKGVSTTRKLGVQYAQGEYIAFLDADDVFKHDKLEKQLKVFQDYPSVVLTHSKVIVNNMIGSGVDEYEFDYSVRNEPYQFKKQQNWLKRNHICNSSVVLKAEAIRKIDFSIKQIFQFEDWLLWSLMAEEGEFYFQREALLEYRLHGTSATSQLLNNGIKLHYSKMEYLFNFFSLTKNADLKNEILAEMKNTLVALMGDYHGESIAEFASKIQLVEADQALTNLVKDNQLLQSDNTRLRAENRTLKSLKKSLIYKIYTTFNR